MSIRLGHPGLTVTPVSGQRRALGLRYRPTPFPGAYGHRIANGSWRSLRFACALGGRTTLITMLPMWMLSARPGPRVRRASASPGVSSAASTLCSTVAATARTRSRVRRSSGVKVRISGPPAPGRNHAPDGPHGRRRTRGSGLTSRRRARSSRARASSWRTTRGSTGRSSSGCSRPRARGPGRARARRFRGPRRASRARRCTVSFASTGSSPGTGTVRSRTARRGCGCSRSASRSRASSVLAAMRRRALTPTVRLWAIRSPRSRIEGGATRAGLPVDAGDAGRNRARVVDRRRARPGRE